MPLFAGGSIVVETGANVTVGKLLGPADDAGATCDDDDGAGVLPMLLISDRALRASFENKRAVTRTMMSARTNEMAIMKNVQNMLSEKASVKLEMAKQSSYRIA